MIDLNQNLILVKDKDATADILQWRYDDGYILITYVRGAQTYRYRSDNVAFYKNPKELNPIDYRVLRNGQMLENVARIQQFERHLRIFYKSNRHEILRRNDVILIASCLRDTEVNHRFAYFCALAHVDTLLGTDGTPILGKRFDKIDFVRDDSILSAYLHGKAFENSTSAPPTLYYPFGFNPSQKCAVDAALNNRLSVIEGPPGTGKTQTILNIIANVVLRGQSVAVVSGNNTATENVVQKLKKYGLDFICAFLGSAQNKEIFLASQCTIPDISAWKLSAEEAQNIAEKLPTLYESLEKKLQQKNKLASVKSIFDALLTEQQHFLVYCAETGVPDIHFKSAWHLSSRALLRLMAQAESMQERGTKFSFWQKICNFLRFGIYDKSFYHNTPERIVTLCQKGFYETYLLELKNQISALEQELATYNFDATMQEYADLSMQLFRQKLTEKYEHQTRNTYVAQDLQKHSSTFIEDYPVVLSTAHSLRSSLSDEFVYDYVIVDEASQVNVTTGALAFSCAKRAVVVGDLKQLSNVVDREMKHRTDAVFETYHPPEAYRYATHSLLLSVTELFPTLPRTMLREHYRCNPKIINFCNEKYYDNQLLILTEESDERTPLVAYKTAPGNHARGHLNQRQIDVILKEVIPQQKLETQVPSVGIVTPYRHQADALQQAFAGTAVKADTVDRFQGQECDVIILSTVDNDISDFADDEHRLNVAISRAVKQLIVVVNGNKSARKTEIGDLLHYIQYNNLEIINSDVYSVFDLLYKQYAAVRRETLAKQKKISEFDSENLMYNIITDVLSEPSFGEYDVLPHVPLHMILRDLSKLTSERETAFVMNENTHADFLIYEKLSHQPVMIVEVDGSRFHQAGSVQAERDALKNQICARYHLPLARFRTTESDEKERFRQMLNMCLKSAAES